MLANGQSHMAKHKSVWSLPLLVSLISLSGCTTLNASTQGSAPSQQSAAPHATSTTNTQQLAENDGATTPQPDQASSKPDETTDATKISRDTLYDLLVAEIAGKRQVYDVAQEKYAAQAEVTQDPSIAARATRIALYRQDYENALKSVDLWKRLDPENPYVYHSDAEIGYHLQDWPKFETAMDRMLELDPDIRMDFVLGDLQALNADQQTELQQSLIKIQSEHPTQPELMFVLAHLLQRANKPDEALAQIDRLLKIEPEHYPSHLFKARLLALQSPEEAIAFLKKTLKQRFQDNKALNVLYARLLIKTKKYDQAEKVFKRLAELHPRDSSFRLSLGLLYMERKHYAGAKEAFQALIDMNQRLDEANYYMGQLLNEEGKKNEALHFLFLVMDGKEFLPAQNLIAQILESQGKVPQARLHLSHMRSQHPKHAPTLYIIEADVLSRSGQKTEAFNLLGDALKQSPEHIDLRYTRAMLAEKIDRLDVLETDLRVIIERNPKNAAALNALGYTLADRTERSQEALQLIQRARDLDPKDPAIIDSLGWVYYRLGNLPKAVTLLKEAYESFPDHEVAAHLGEVLWMMGDQDKAKTVWSEGLEMNPQSPILRDTFLRLLGSDKLPD